jgi:hypothetical protein
MEFEIKRLTQQLADAVKMLSEQGYEYNRKTNAIIERHSHQLAECQSREKVLRDALNDEAAAWADIKLHAAKIGDDWLGTFADTMIAAITKELE